MDPISAEQLVLASMKTRRCLGDMAGLLAAAKRGDTRETERLIKAGSRLRVTDDDGANALHLAAFNGHPDTTQVLVELGASIESKTTRGETPLLLAASQGRAEVAQVLLNAGARVDAVDALGNTAAHFAAKNNHVRVLEVRNCHPPLPPTPLTFTPRSASDASPLCHCLLSKGAGGGQGPAPGAEQQGRHDAAAPRLNLRQGGDC